jgi:hypothetical protein
MAELLSLLSLIGIGLAFLLVARHLDRSQHDARRKAFVLNFPRGITPDTVESFVRSLAGLQLPYWQRVIRTPAIVFEVHASHDEIDFRILVEAGAAEFVLSQLRGAIPGVHITEGDATTFMPTLAAELRLSGAERQLRVDRPGEISSALLSALRPLEPDEHLMYQWVITPASSSALAGQSEMLRRLWGSQDSQVAKPDKAVRDKASASHFLAAVRLASRANSPRRAQQLVRRLLGVFHITNAPQVRFRRRLIPNRVVSARVRDARTPLLPFPCVLNTKELAALIGIPVGEIMLPGLTLSQARQLPVPTKLPETGPAFAISNYPGTSRPLTFGYRSLPYHGWVIGGTGSGKSTLLLRLLVDYMQAGATIVVLDSKRDLVRDFVQVIDPKRGRDLVLIDPADQRPVGVNVLAGAQADADRITDQLVGIFCRLWPDAVGPRSQDLLRAGFATLMQNPGSTLVELPLLLYDEAFRRRMVSKIDDPIVLGPQWAAFDNLSAAERAAHIAAPLNKVRAVLARRALRDIVGQSEGLDIAEVLERGSILAVPLSKGLIGEDSASLLGSILLLKIWQALTARVGLASTDRRPVLVVLDEFQDYLAAPFAMGDMLAQARALGVGVVVAHQHQGQLPARLRLDLRSNARTKIAFQLDAPNARLLAQEFSPFLKAEDLQGLGQYEIAAQICVDGRVLAPATATTLPPPKPTGAGDQARELSRQRYGRDRDDIEAEIRRRHGDRPGPGAVGRRRRP